MSNSKAKTEALEALHGALAQALADKIKEGTATASDLNVARQFLKDNGVDAIPRGAASPLQSLVDSLPFPGEEDPENTHLN